MNHVRVVSKRCCSHRKTVSLSYHGCRLNHTGPISVRQFRDELERVLGASRLIDHKNPDTPSAHGASSVVLPRRVGIAVSGGADSMALAFLCKKLQEENLEFGKYLRDGSFTSLSYLRAFIVDHGAREGSAKEARQVADWLMKIGVESELIQLEWPESDRLDPFAASAFETKARRLRFQSLGLACSSHKIDTLLLGHHQDDNIEQTLLRLCGHSKSASGLGGIQAVARIPECHGFFGISRSGSSRTIRSHGSEAGNAVKFSSGGVVLCRPLLSFPKSALLDTCSEHNIPFVTDSTNFDPTLTPRNAIRQLLSEGRLPRALQGPSILRLMQNSQRTFRDALRDSNSLLEHCQLIELNLHSGSMSVQFPAPTSLDVSKDQRVWRRRREIESITLRRITELLAPNDDNHYPVGNFTADTGRVFHGEEPDKSFAVGKVMFRPKVDGTNTWFLSRQLSRRRELPIMTLDVPLHYRPEELSKNSIRGCYTFKEEEDEETWSPWTLWDSRYWFRFRAFTFGKSKSLTIRQEQHQKHHHPQQDYESFSTEESNETNHIKVKLRPLKKDDMYMLRNQLSKPSEITWQRIRGIFSCFAVADIRWSLPVVCFQSPSSSSHPFSPRGFGSNHKIEDSQNQNDRRQHKQEGGKEEQVPQQAQRPRRGNTLFICLPTYNVPVVPTARCSVEDNRGSFLLSSSFLRRGVEAFNPCLYPHERHPAKESEVENDIQFEWEWMFRAIDEEVLTLMGGGRYIWNRQASVQNDM